MLRFKPDYQMPITTDEPVKKEPKVERGSVYPWKFSKQFNDSKIKFTKSERSTIIKLL